MAPGEIPSTSDGSLALLVKLFQLLMMRFIAAKSASQSDAEIAL